MNTPRSALCSILWIAVLHALSGCSGVQHYEQGPWRAYASGEEPARFESLTLRLRQLAQAPTVVCLQLAPDSAPVRSDQLTPSLVASQLPPFQIPRYWPEVWKRRALEGQAFEGNGYYIAFSEGRLTQLTLSLRETDPVNPVTRPVTRPPRVGPASCSRLYRLPLTRQQLDEVLGPGGRVNRQSEVYY